MTEEKVITLSEFQVVMEEMRSQNKKIIEVMQHNQEQANKRFDRVEETIYTLREQVALLHEGQTKIEGRLDRVEGRLGRVEGRLDQMEGNICTLQEQVTLLHEGQTEIKAALSRKVDRTEFARLKKRVSKPERRLA